MSLVCKQCGAELLSPLEAQNVLGVSEPTIARWRREGYLHGTEFRRGYLYTREELEHALVLRNKDRDNQEVTYA